MHPLLKKILDPPLYNRNTSKTDMLLAICHLYLVDSSKNNDDDDDVAWCLVMIMVMMKSMQAMHK